MSKATPMGAGLAVPTAPAMSWDRVRAVLTEELGAPPDVIFRRIESQPFATAWCGQVHRAELPNGDRVAVKIQHPGMADSVRREAKKASEKMRRVAAGRPPSEGADPDKPATDFEARVLAELDYKREARNIERFRVLLADDTEVVIPRAHGALCSARVLTMDYLDGYLATELISGGDPELKGWLVGKLFSLYWRQVLEFGVLHGDVHPGNYLVMPGYGIVVRGNQCNEHRLVTHGPRLGMLDFGSVRDIGPEFQSSFVRLARGLLAEDDDALCAAVVALGLVSPNTDPAPTVRALYSTYALLVRDEVIDLKQIALPGIGGDNLYSTLRAFGAARNWHRLFRAVVDRVPGGQGGQGADCDLRADSPNAPYLA